jgi:hypothetical protein
MYAIAPHKIANRRKIKWVEFHIGAHILGAGIAWGNVKLAQAIALAKFPGHGVFSSSRPDQQYIHPMRFLCFKGLKFIHISYERNQVTDTVFILLNPNITPLK